MAAEPRTLISREAYLAMERESAERHEYIAGEVFAMAGGTVVHDVIFGNTFTLLRASVRPRGCQVFSGNVRIAIDALDIYTYPDITVICGPPQFEDNRRDTLLNPQVLIEILSPSTERYDRGQKFHQYQYIPTFDTYVLIAQDRPLVEQYVRQEDGSWRWSAARGLDATLVLPTIDCSLALAEVYDLVEFPRLLPHP